MKFTALSLIPAVVLTWTARLAQTPQDTLNQRGAMLFVLGLAWFLTVAVLGVYWVSRIWHAGARRSR